MLIAQKTYKSEREQESERARERESERARERESERVRERERDTQRWRKKYGDAKMVPRKAKRFTARVGETGRRMKERIQFKNSYTSFLRMTQSGWGDGAADKKSAVPSPEWWQIRRVLLPARVFFYAGHPLK